jgi:His-Xaa-Ser system radical SAM maturase HxsC
MLTLAGQAIKLRGFECSDNNVVLRITDRNNRPAGIRAREALLVGAEVPSEGFGAYVTLQANSELLDALPEGARTVILPDTFEYLAAGDVIRISPRQRRVRTLYRLSSAYNSILLTERCNHYCLMCSQPPKDVNDNWIVDDVLSAIPLMDTSTRNINLTGGEPTLLGQDFLRVVRMAKSYLPNTALHVLSNGRRFADAQFTAQYAAIAHPDIMVGIPLYSDISTIHDYVVQADGAYDETIRGILRLKERSQKVEIRVVVHKQTYKRLPKLAEFIARNLTFVDQVVFMGLEITGFTRANLGALWIDPVDYQPELYSAVTLLKNSRIKVGVYNHQLCVLDKRLWSFSRKSISDWKNEFMDQCDGCGKKSDCGGFFASSVIKHSGHIRPIEVQIEA